MYLSYLYLKNYDYFLTGMNKKEMEFKFNKDDNIIVITGDNGTGKSSLALLAINPFNKTERGFGITEGEKGKKVQKFVDEESGYKYEIIHEFKPLKSGSHSCNSYLNRYKDGKKEELNESGKQTSFNEAIKKHFNITSDIVDVLSLTTDDFGIVSKTPYKRRDYIKTLISGLEEIDNRYDIVNDKYRAIKKERSANETKLSNYPDSERIKKDIEENEKLIAKMKKTSKKLSRKIGKIDKIDEGKLKELKDGIAEIKKENKKADTLIGFIEDFDNDDSIQFNINELENKINNANDKIDDGRKDLEKLNKRYLKVKKEIKSLDDLKENAKYLKKLEKKVDNTDDEIKELDPDISREEFREYINRLQKIMTSLEMVQDNLTDKTLVKEDVDEKYYDDLLDEKRKEIKELNKTIKDKKEEYSDINKKGITYLTQADIPEECERKCGVKDLLTEAEADNKRIDKLETKIEKLNTELSGLKSEKEILKNNIKWLKEINSLIDDTKEMDKFFNIDKSFMPLYKDNIIKVIKNGTINKVKGRIELKIEQYRKHYDFKENKEKLDSLSVMSNSENNLLDKLTDELEEISDKKQEIADSIEKYNNKVKKLERRLKKLNKIDADYFLMNMNKETLIKHKKENKKEIEEINKELEKKQEQLEELQELEKEEEEIEDSLDKMSKKVDELKSKKSVMEHLETEFIRLKKEERISYAVKEILRVHLPVKVMDSFLESVKIYANQFLEDSNLPFRVSSFEVSDQIFRIETTKNGRVYNDVSEMSKGEKALISLSISFAKQRVIKSLDKYRIISLDEVDSSLKVEKKEIFKNIVLQQADLFDLNQVFLVTHNENFTKMNNVSHICFDKSNVDPYSNKRIIYHYKKD